MTTDQKTITEFLNERGSLQFKAIKIPARTDTFEDWKDASHYLCTFTWLGKSFSIQYSMGSAHKKSPNIEDVFNCILLDVSALDQSFEDWASDFGYDSDSRKAYAIWEACRENAKKLKDFLGNKDFQEALQLERL